jgi:hypothetical protein
MDRRAANHRRYRVLASAAIHLGCDVAALQNNLKAQMALSGSGLFCVRNAGEKLLWQLRLECYT